MKTTIALVPDAYIKAVLSGMIILLTEQYVLYSTCETFNPPTHHGTVAVKKKFTHRFRATETIQQLNGNNTETKRKHGAKPETQNCTKTELKIANKTETAKRK